MVEKVQKQPWQPQRWEDCEAKLIWEFEDIHKVWTEAGLRA